MDEIIKTWIAQSRVAGMSDEQMRLQLLQQGWQAKDIHVFLPPTKTKIRKTVFKTVLYIFLAVVVLLVGLTAIRGSGFLTKMFPSSNLAAQFSNYSSSISTYTGVKLTASTQDGNVLFGRAFQSYRIATGLRAFPDGGSVYPLMSKFDLFLIREDGSIVWERNFIARAAPKYNYKSKFSVTDQQDVQIANVPELSMGEYIDNDRWIVRWCSPSTVQIALEGKVRANPQVPALLTPWAQVDLTNGSYSIVRDAQQTCALQVSPEPSARVPYQCDATVDFLHKAGGLVNEYDMTGPNKVQKHEVQKVFWQFPCWGHYENAKLEIFNQSVLPGDGDDTTLVY